MAIVDSPAFSLNDVIVELGLPTASSLSTCFASASASSFDATYEGVKDRLSNFRNYGAWLWGDNVTYTAQKTLTGLPVGFLRGGIYVKSDGTKAFFLDNANRKVVEYTMTAHNVSTTTYNAISPTDITLNWSSVVFADCLYFNSTGTKCYIYSDSNDYKLYEHTLSTAWNISTLSNTVTNSATFTGLSVGTYNKGLQVGFSSDGTLLFIAHGDASGNLKVRKYLLNTAWDISTINNLGGESELALSALGGSDSRLPVICKIDPSNNSSDEFMIVENRTIAAVLAYRFDQFDGFSSGTIISYADANGTSGGGLEFPSIVNRDYLYTIDANEIFRKYTVSW